MCNEMQSTSYYHKAVDSGSQLLNKAQQTSVYRSAKTNFYPRVASYTDPAYDKITSSSYYKAAVDHLRPVSPYTAKAY